MLKVAIVGCGKIADQHVQAIRRIPDSQVVALCDRELLMAKQLGERFHVDQSFDDVGTMLRAVRPDVVHITTPPQSHYSLGRECIEAGSHVYLEKPFTVDAHEAESLLSLATERNRLVTAGHNYQFTPEMLEMRRLVGERFLGDRAVHVESYWSYDLSDLSYVGPMLGNKDHWVRRLPGQLFHNLISHGIARVAEFLDDDVVEIVTIAQQSATLRDLGGQEVKDQLLALLRDKTGTTALFSFNTQIKPGLNQFRVCGASNSLSIDMSSGSVVRNFGRSYKSYLTFLIPPLNAAREHLANARRNARGIFGGTFHQDSGMKELISRFHHCITEGSPPPIPYREILLTARIMDRIFTQIQSDARDGQRAQERIPVLVS